MSTRATANSLFSRKPQSSSEPPADDPAKAPFGWMWDRSLGQWRPRKSWGGAGKGAHKVAQEPKPAAKGGRPAGRPKGARKAPKSKPRAEQLHVVEETEPDTDETWLDMMTRDPDAAWQTDPAPEPEQREDQPAKVLRQEVMSWIALGWSIPADALATMDPYCFAPLVDDQTGPLVVKSLADIAMQSPKVVEFIASKSGLRPYIELAVVFKPVFANMWRHHIARKVEVDIDRENMTYTVTPKDYSQYPAA